MSDEELSLPHWKVQQRLRRAHTKLARTGKLQTFGTLIATSPLISQLRKELNEREAAERKR